MTEFRGSEPMRTAPRSPCAGVTRGGRARLLVLALAAALLGSGRGAASQDTATAAQITAEITRRETETGCGRLTLEVTERRGGYQAAEQPEETRKRLAAQPAIVAEGTFEYGPAGWVKDLVVSGTRNSRLPTHTRTGEMRGVLRILVEATVDGKEQKLGRVTRAATTAPGDAVLSRRVSRAMTGITWSTATPDGERITLVGSRASETHTLVFRRSMGPWLESWRLTRRLDGPSGERLEQTYLCEVTYGEAPGSLARLEEWVLNSPPAGNAAHRVTHIKGLEILPVLKPEALAVRFPQGTLVTDARGGVPVEYEQTEEGIDEELVARAASALTRGRADQGDTAPAFALRDTRGKPVQLESYRGKPLLLYWFSSRTPRAEAAASVLRELSQEYARKGVQFLGLMVDPGVISREAAEAFRKRVGWSFPILFDVGSEGLRRYGKTVAVPKVALVDAGGRLAYVQAGIDPEGIQAQLDRLTAAAPR